MSYSFIDGYGSVQTAESSVVLGGAQRQVVTIGSFLGVVPVTFSGASSVSGTVGASVIGLTPVNIVGNASVSGTVGASIIGWVPIQPSDTSIISIVRGSIAATMAGPWSSSVQGTVSILGTVPVTQSGGWQVSIVSTVPSSVLVGASIFGSLPPSSVMLISGGNTIGNTVILTAAGTNVNTSNGNAASGTLRVAIASDNSVLGVTVVGSIVGTYSEDAGHTSADKGLFVLGVRNDAVASFVSADLEYTPRATDSAGRALTKPFAPEESRVEGYISLTSTSVTTLVAAAGAGLRNYITDIWVANTGAATTLVTFSSGGGSSVLGFTIAPTGGGSNLQGLQTPIRTEANATFGIQAGTATSTLYCTVKGYRAP